MTAKLLLHIDMLICNNMSAEINMSSILTLSQLCYSLERSLPRTTICHGQLLLQEEKKKEGRNHVYLL
jgi:hypothetical protein